MLICKNLWLKELMILKRLQCTNSLKCLKCLALATGIIIMQIKLFSTGSGLMIREMKGCELPENLRKKPSITMNRLCITDTRVNRLTFHTTRSWFSCRKPTHWNCRHWKSKRKLSAFSGKLTEEHLLIAKYLQKEWFRIKYLNQTSRRFLRSETV